MEKFFDLKKIDIKKLKIADLNLYEVNKVRVFTDTHLQSVRLQLLGHLSRS
jgi:hypothetical protein